MISPSLAIIIPFICCWASPVPWLFLSWPKKVKNQSKLGVGLGIIYIIGLATMLLSDGVPALIIAIICCGFCSGACISFSMALFDLHTKNAADTSALSSLAQSVGYLLAAIGPIALGKIYDVCHSWTMPLVLLLILALVLTVLGYLAGREKIINN